MKVKTRLCKLSAMIMEEIAKVPEDLDEEDLSMMQTLYIGRIERNYQYIKWDIKGICNEQTN